MRENLFRGNRADNGKWAYGYYCLFKGSSDIFVPFTEEEEKQNEGHIFSVVGGLWNKVIPETVGQFIGLTDKNGKKIFEGDIMSERGCLFVVVYDTKWARFKLQHIGREIQYPEWNRGVQMEIVGNIHDNPELLEG